MAFKKLGKEALKKSVDDIAKKLLKTCVFACFPAGTLIQTQHGTKPIENIQIGDLVWAYDEDTNTTALQPVVDIMENESDHTISLFTEYEVIETTALHPFYTQEGWKDASELQAGDQIKTQSHEIIEIKDTKFNYEPKKVYNFTVGNFHTYFVGALAWLVHNSQKCLSKMMLESQKWFQNMMRGNSFNMVMNNALSYLYSKKGLKYLDEVYVSLKNGKKGRIDGFIKGKAIIERKATDLAKVTENTAKSYVDNAAKYKNAELGGKELTEKVFLQVENMNGVSQNVLDHATKKGVEIIDDITKLPGL